MGSSQRLVLLTKNDITQAMDRYKVLADFFNPIPDILLEHIGVKVIRYRASAMKNKRYYSDIDHDGYIDAIAVTIDGKYKNPMHSDKELYEVLSIVGHRIMDELSIIVNGFDMLAKGRDFYEKPKV